MPDALGFATSLVSLDLSGNAYTGTVSCDLGRGYPYTGTVSRDWGYGYPFTVTSINKVTSQLELNNYIAPVAHLCCHTICTTSFLSLFYRSVFLPPIPTDVAACRMVHPVCFDAPQPIGGLQRIHRHDSCFVV